MTPTKQGADQTPESTTDAPRPIAPPWHTAALVLLISAVSLVGLLLMQRGRPPTAPETSGKLAVYLPMIVAPWLLTFYVARVGREPRAHRSLASLIGRRWDSWGRAAVDLGVALALALLIFACERALAPPADAARAAALATLLPRTVVDRLAWLLVAASVGFGEEVVYRGYLQTQLGALTRRPRLGVLLQALLFGVAHLEQGPTAAARVALYGLFFGVLVRARRSLVPAIIAHVLVDAATAFV